VSTTAAPAGLSYALFGTVIGRCALVWSACGVAGLLLPEVHPEATARHARRRHPGAVPASPTPPVSDVIGRVAAHLAGTPDDLADVPLDVRGRPAFACRVWQATRAVPPGSTVSYRAIAVAVGEPDAARAVGRALGQNPCPILVPCHRVLAADGSLHGFSAPGGLATKRRLLEMEGALPPPQPVLF
jgi:methylated-DNA-[protein]-cysteine S-methyltransferase